jgi:DNA replication protein DnaC
MPNPRDADHVPQALHPRTLEGMASRLDALCEQAAKAAWSYATVWAPVLRAELTARDARRRSVTTNMARGPLHTTWAPFDVAFHPRVETRRIQELARCRVVAGGSNGLLVGPPGVGKTPLALGLGLNALQAGLRTSFVRVPDRIDRSCQAAPRGQWLKRLQPLCKPHRWI